MGDLLDDYEAAQGSDETEPVSLFDSFETFSGASGTSVAGFSGDSDFGLWSASGSVVICGDGTAFHGEAYLRLVDNDSKQHNATLKLAQSRSFSLPIEDGSGTNGIPFSFAFRRTAVKGSAAPLTGCKFKIAAFCAISNAWTRTSDGSDIFATPSAAKEILAETGVWFQIEGRLLRTPLADGRTRIGLRADRIRDGMGNCLWRTAKGKAPWYILLDTSLPGGDLHFREFTFFSYSTNQGWIDIDAIRFGALPQEATLMLVY